MQAKLTVDFAETKLYKIRCKFDSACQKNIKLCPSGASRTRDCSIVSNWLRVLIIGAHEPFRWDWTLQPDAINQLDDRGFGLDFLLL